MTRNASLEDAAAVAAIYNKCVLESTATFETEPLSDEQMRARMAEIIGRGFPYIAGEIGGEFAGFACAHLWRERPAYGRTLETTVYVAEKFRGQGVGAELLGELIERCEKLPDAHALVACITSETSRARASTKNSGSGKFRIFGRWASNSADTSGYQTSSC